MNLIVPFGTISKKEITQGTFHSIEHLAIIVGNYQQ